jgi:acyl transferase domain-containing protein
MNWDIQNIFPASTQRRLFKLQQDVDLLHINLQLKLTPYIEEESMQSEQPLETTALSAKISQTPIAIVGMASLFPQAKDLQEYWNNIIQKTDCITDVPASRWNIDDYYDPDPTVPDKTYCKRGGFIPDIDFNPIEFGLPPNILEVTDITQILSLVVAKQALQDAGYDQANDAVRDRTGVILGVGGGQKLITPLTARLQSPILEKVLTSSGLSAADAEKIVEKVKLAYIGWEENSFPGMLGNVIAGRIANRLDLGGINCVVDAACASSLSALQMALDQLTSGRSDMMITGGVDADNSPFMYLCFSKTPAFSKQDQMRPFDVNSDGMIVGEGIGMMVLKRLVDAERDGDRIYAVIKGIGTSSDGKYKSIYAPRSSGQAKALRRAYEDADCDPNTVRLIEAHGTATGAGDPAEFAALQEVFSEAQTDMQAIALGSVKSQIGHTKSAAGAASMIKAALALHHKILPPTLNITQPNPKLNIEQSPFYLNTESRAWMRTDADSPRRAGVSSFGFGGTNYHVVLEEYTGKQAEAYRLHQVPEILLFAATDPAQLVTQCETVLANWQSDVAEQHYRESVIASRSIFVPKTSARLGFVAANLNEAKSLLQTAIQTLKNQMSNDTWQHPQGICYRRTGMETAGKVVALFPGQGSQYVNMGRELALNFPTIRQSFSAIDALFQRDQLSPISEAVYPRPVFDATQQQLQANALQKTEQAQPAIGALSMGMYNILRQAGFQPDFVAGHSFGEVTALWAAKVLSDEDYRFLVKARGQALATPGHPNFDAGTMLAITGDLDTIESVVKNFPNVMVANWNSKTQIVLAGATPEIANVEHRFTEFGCTTARLPVSAAFHTPLVSYAYQQFAQALRVVNFNAPTLPVYSNVTAEPYPLNATEIGQTLASQLLNPVCFKQEIEQIYQAGGNIFVEIGPRSVLTHLVQNILEGQPHLAISLNPSRNGDADRQFRAAVMQLQVAGLALKNLDPHGIEMPIAAPAKPGMTVRLNGSNYVSEKTKNAFEAALQDGFQISRQAQPVSPSIAQPQPVAQVQPQPEVQPKLQPQLEASHFITPMLQVVSEKTGYPTEMLSLSMDMEADLGIDSIKRVEILGAMQDQFPDLPPMQPEILSELRTLEQIVQYLSQQDSGHRSTNDSAVYHTTTTPIGSSNKPATESIAEPHDRNSPNNDALVRSLLNIVSEKTGYPVEMLSLGMDMEADLGIDSIKRVEILGAMQDEFTDMPAANPETLAEMRTLAQIVDYMGQSQVILTTPAPVTIPVAPPVALPVAIPAIVPVAPAAQSVQSAAPDFGDLITALLTIVSEKTGYPTEMLNLSMDMEADLGIDSIKRVEILGAVQDTIPDLPTVNPEALAEMRTLEQIVQYMGQQASMVEKKKLTQAESIAATESMTIALGETTIQRGQATLTPLPPPDWLDFSCSSDSVCLVTDDGSALTTEFAQELKAQGNNVVVLSFPEILVTRQQPFSLPIPRIQLHDMSETHLKQQIESITQQYGQVAAFIHLQPQLAVDLKAVTAARSQDVQHPAATTILKHLFLIAKHLKRSLTEVAQPSRSCFLTVTRLDGAFGLNAERLNTAQIISGGLFGLTKTLNLEWPQVFCRAVDIAPDYAINRASQIILQELHDPDRLTAEVGYSDAGRVSLTCGNLVEATSQATAIDPNTVFLVSGGGKGITAQCITQLAKFTRCKFILLGRSELSAEPAWANGATQAAELKQRAIVALMVENPKTTPIAIQKAVNAVLSQREIASTLQAIREAGGEAEYVSVDLTQASDLRASIGAIEQRLGKVTGIIHGAGTLADKLIENKSEKDFELVYTTKITGLNTLLNSVDCAQIKHLVLFSSAAGFYGNIGQSDYAIANEILNKFAHQFKRQYPTCHVISFNWGPWDSGMVTPEVKRIFAERKIEVIPTEIGTTVFVQQLLQGNSETVQVLVGSPLAVLAASLEGDRQTYQIRRRLDLSINQFLKDHQIGGEIVLPIVCSAAWIADSGEKLYPGHHFFRCEQHKVLKGIVFDESLAEEYILNLEEVNVSGPGEVRLKAMIWSELPNGKPRYHYSSEVTLVQELPPSPYYQSFDLTPNLEAGKLSPYQDGTLFHGSSFQGIQRVLNLTPERLTLECVLPQLENDQRQQFDDRAIDAIAHDIQYQCILIWVRQFHQAGSLPLSCQLAEQFRPVPIGVPIYVSLEVLSSTATKLLANVITHDAQGQVYSQVSGAEVTISQALNRLFDRSYQAVP